jgi:hypothetical protein
MPAASIMAEVEPSPATEPGAPIAKNAIDPDLVRLKRARPKVGLITSAGLVFLCGFYLYRMNADRRFSGSDPQPMKIAVADVLADKVAPDSFVTIDVDPLMSHAIRATTAKGTLGLRVVPARGTGERLWLVVSGDGWEPATKGGYTGRLRKLTDLPLSSSVAAFAAEQPRPMFATSSEIRAGITTGKVKTVTGDVVSLGDGDRVAFDVVDPKALVVDATFNDRFKDVAAWKQALDAAGIATTGVAETTARHALFEVSQSSEVAPLMKALQDAKLWATRVVPATHHYETTWGGLKGSASPTSFTVKVTSIPDVQIDVVGLYVAREIPRDAYALITGERPDDYWYVLPVTIGVAVIGLLFAWALVRAVKRDLLPARA